MLLGTCTILHHFQGTQGQQKAKPVNFIFSHTSADQDEIWSGFGAIQVEHSNSNTTFEWD